MAELGMTPHPTGSHVRLSPSPKGEGRKTTRLRVASNRRADWQVVLCARGARASSQGLCPKMKNHQLSWWVPFLRKFFFIFYSFPKAGGARPSNLRHPSPNPYSDERETNERGCAPFIFNPFFRANPQKLSYNFGYMRLNRE